MTTTAPAAPATAAASAAVPATSPQGAATPVGQNRSLNALRAIAATLVVLTHVRTLFMADPDAGWGAADRALHVLSGMGPAAVLVFFVLSGYWVGGSVLSSFRRGSFRWSSYGSARLTRLWIVLIPAVAVTALLDTVGMRLLPGSSVYLGDPAYHRTVPAEDLEGHLSPLAALGNILFVQTNLVPSYGTNASLWSLAYEATFYLVLPLALFTVFARRTSAKLISLALLVVVCAIGGIDVLMYLPVWLMGAAVAWQRDRIAAFLRRRDPRLVALAQLTAAVAVVAAMSLTSIRYSNAHVALLALATTALVALLTIDLPWTGLRGRALDGLSRYADSSYSLYAVHLPIVALLAAIIVPSAAQRWSPTPLHWAGVLAVVAAMLVVGWLFAAVTERRTEQVRTSVETRLPVGRESGTGFRALRSGRHAADR